MGDELLTPSRKRLLAAKLDRATGSKRRALHVNDGASESDKDSGFSDGSSEYLSAAEQTSSEDMPNFPSWILASRAQQNTMLVNSPFSALSPMFFMKNVLVKQPICDQLVQSWAVQPSIEVIPAQPQLLLVQPAVPQTINSRSTRDNKADSGSYLPILKSYAKIAPHPGKKLTPGKDAISPRDGRRGLSDSHKKQKRVETSRTSSAFRSSSAAQPFSPQSSGTNKQQNSEILPSNRTQTNSELACNGHTGRQEEDCFTPTLESGHLQLSANAASDEALFLCPSPSVGQIASAQELGPAAATSGQMAQQQSKQKRFQNTFDVLHKSGLLGITLKTKELARQNQSTQNELDQLKEQTRLFVEVLQSNNPLVLAQLLESMTAGTGVLELDGLRDGENDDHGSQREASENGSLLLPLEQMEI
ncbi:CLOCK-interacting pacemaker a [Latimeria chalumnae]|uniref:CLOCK interacting pacemaker n=1 Tax=Latimeria chalumnae TaxID=7897 RepID=H3AVF9_LATCH|nr:PREDICTED: CLOCK-interacting pacemaker [Latimeria chalumnae]|eukprot:XP_005986588.1 PREDICTED: CLOCK-interacting pacemaker [Latimeria chalumnae]